MSEICWFAAAAAWFRGKSLAGQGLAFVRERGVAASRPEFFSIDGGLADRLAERAAHEARLAGRPGPAPVYRASGLFGLLLVGALCAALLMLGVMR